MKAHFISGLMQAIKCYECQVDALKTLAKTENEISSMSMCLC